MPETTGTLRGISEIRAFFRTNQTPIYFISPTAFNLLGIDRWLRNFFYVNYFDSFEGTHPRVFVPQERPYREFESMEDICNYLLAHKEVLDRIAQPRPAARRVRHVRRRDRAGCGGGRARGRAPVARSCATGWTRRSSPRSSATRRACRARRTCSAARRAYDELHALADSAGLGDDLVVQTPYGDSGKTTFFIRGQRDWDEYAERHGRRRSSRS